MKPNLNKSRNQAAKLVQLNAEELTKLISEEPENNLYLKLRGEFYLRVEDYEAALRDYAKLVSLNNQNVDILINFASCLIRCNKYDQAQNVLEYVLELEPKNLNAHINICSVFQAQGRPEESLKMALKAIEINPKVALPYNNLGTAFGDLQMISEAREAYKIAHELAPEYVPTVINLAQLEVKQNNHEQAITLYEGILTSKKLTNNQRDLISYYLSYSYLYIGELEKGWALYEFGYGGLLPLGAIRSLRKFKQPKWSGELIKNKKLLIWREQGLGDEIEFSTCLPDVQKLGLSVILECESRLVDAFKRSFPEWEVRPERVGNDGYPLADDFDFHCPVGSLPRIFRNSINSFANNQKNLLSPSLELKEKYFDRLKPYKNKKLVGISWRGGKLSIERNMNYTSILDWIDIFKTPNCQFVNLQYGECEEELLEVEKMCGIEILRWPDLDLKNNLEEVMALTSNLDYVVSVGTAIGSIAPAIGTPTILLTLRHWLLLGEKSSYPWFKCVTPLIAAHENGVASQLKFVPPILSAHNH